MRRSGAYEIRSAFGWPNNSRSGTYNALEALNTVARILVNL